MTDLSTSAGDASEKQTVKIALIVMVLAILAGLALFSPVLSQPPLYDESYLLSWWAHSISSGLFSADAIAQLKAASFDLRDGQNLLGNLCQMLAAICTGTNYGAMRLLQIDMHLASALMLFFYVYKCGTNISNQKNSEKKEVTTSALTALAAAILFIVYPLSPEAVGWLGGIPVEAAVLSTLFAAVQALHSRSGPKTYLSSAVLLFIAPWISVKVLPLTVLVLTLSGILSQRIGRPALIAVSLSAALALGVHSVKMTDGEAVVPQTIRQLKIEKIIDTDSAPEPTAKLSIPQLMSDARANLEAMLLPVNRKIDERYNKVLRRFYFILGVEAVVFLIAFVLNPALRRLAFAAALSIGLGAVTAGGIDSTNFYGAHWLYPILPAAALLLSLLATSGLYLKGEGKFGYLKIICAVLFVCMIGYLFTDRTLRQCSSYKSNGKLWKVVQATVEDSGRKRTSPFIVVRNLPQSLSIAPIISPFSPQLLDTQSGLPRTTSLAAGAFKDAIKQDRYHGLVLHYRQQYESFLPTELEAVNRPFGPSLNAVQIADQLSPPLSYYQGTVTLDKQAGLLHLTSQTKMGPAVRMQSLGLSPAQDDFLCIEAKIVQTGKAQTPVKPAAELEMHWLTNWQGDWDGRDRKVTTSASNLDGQFHKYYFPLRSLAWLTSGLPTDIMFGFPRGTTVDLKSVSVIRNLSKSPASDQGYEHLAMPSLRAHAEIAQNNNRLYYSHFCFDYPDAPEFGLCAVYGANNSLQIDYDAGTIDGATSATIEFARGLENSTVCKTVDCPGKSGNVSVKSAALAEGRGGIFSVRVRAIGQDGKAIGPVSDSLIVLFDPDL